MNKSNPIYLKTIKSLRTEILSFISNVAIYEGERLYEKSMNSKIHEFQNRIHGHSYTTNKTM